jgi:hypothetical protein
MPRRAPRQLGRRALCAATRFPSRRHLSCSTSDLLSFRENCRRLDHWPAADQVRAPEGRRSPHRAGARRRRADNRACRDARGCRQPGRASPARRSARRTRRTATPVPERRGAAASAIASRPRQAARLPRRDGRRPNRRAPRGGGPASRRPRQKPARLLSIPILGSANCGPADLLADQNLEGYLRVSLTLVGSHRSSSRLFAIRAVGSSMNKTSVDGKAIEEGDYLILDGEDVGPENGKCHSLDH